MLYEALSLHGLVTDVVIIVSVPKAYKRPEFVEELRALLTEQGTVSLECKVVGVPTPVLRWFKVPAALLTLYIHSRPPPYTLHTNLTRYDYDRSTLCVSHDLFAGGTHASH